MNSDTAVDKALLQENLPFENFVSVYQDNPTPNVSAKYGAPMGRMSNNLDHNGNHKAEVVKLDEGYDEGGAYWGCRFGKTQLFSVQDGMGNIAFVDAISNENAILEALS